MRTVSEHETEQAAKRQEAALDWRGLRLALGLRQSELANLLYLTHQSLSAIERGEAYPSRQTIAILRAWLTVPEYRGRLVAANFANPFPDDVCATAVTEDKPAGSL